MDRYGEKLMAVLLLVATCFLGIFFNGWSLLVIVSNDKLSSAVRLYFIGDLAARIANYCIAVFFSTPCAFLFFCAEPYNEFTVGWLINRICGYSKKSLMFSTKFFTLALALNRFFAVFQKGQYYQLTASHVRLQFVGLVFIPFLLLSPLMLEQQAYAYDPGAFGWYYIGHWAELVVTQIDYDLTIAIWVLVIFLDSVTAWMIRKSKANAGTTSVRKMDVQIMKQTCFLGIFFNGWSLLVIVSNDKLSSAVRLYFIGDLAARIANYCIAVFFSTPCAFLFFCAEPYNEFTVGWLINRICGYSKKSLMFSTKFFTLALALNRFFAVFQKGQYYQLTASHVRLQFVGLVFIPFLLLSPLMLEQQAYAYDPGAFGWYYIGHWAELVVTQIDYDLTIAIWVLVIFLDSVTAWMIRKSKANAGTTSVRKMDVQIMKQVCSFHAVSLTYFIFLRIFAFTRSFDHWSKLGCFGFYDFLPAIVDMLAGISRVYYLRAPKSKKRNTSISTVIDPAPLAFATKTRKSITRMTG